MGQAVVNIGTLGHVDHGKTSLTKALTGIWTDRHSEEIKRGITIRIGYADAVFARDKEGNYFSHTIEPQREAVATRKVSFLDAPGHETLMTTAIAASSIVDGVLFVVAANEECPQPQTLEHTMIMKILGIKHVVVAQTKIDLVSKERARQQYQSIRALMEDKGFVNVPIIPVSATYGINIDALIEAIETTIPTPQRDTAADPLMYVARSFDVNRPGTPIEKLCGGVLGGSLIRGKLKVGDEIEIAPGFEKEEKGKRTYEPIYATVTSLHAGNECLDEAIPGGLIAIGTELDPSFTKSDKLIGNVVGKPGKLPPILEEMTIEFHLLERPDFKNPPLTLQEPVVVSVGTRTSVGFVISSKHNRVFLKLKNPIVAEKGHHVAISRRIGQRWRLSGFGIIL